VTDSRIPTGCPVQEQFDPLAADYQADPYAVLSRLPLAETPVFYAPAIDYYVVTRYDDIEAVFRDHETYSAAAAQLPLVSLVPEAAQILLDGGHKPQPSMVSLDPPLHERLRGPAARAFTPKRVTQMEAVIRARARDLLAAVGDTSPFDVIAALAFPLPATTIFTLMGVPQADWPQLKEWCRCRAGLAWGRPRPEEQVDNATDMVAYRRYLRELVVEKADRRADDFTSDLLAIHDEDPEALTIDEIASILFSLSFAGHETSNNLIGNSVRRLLEDRSRWAEAVADPSVIPNAVNEVLRFDPSVPVWRRMTKKATKLGGVELPEGAKLFLWLAAAGRDPSQFSDPERFDLRRPDAGHHLAFGKGIHYCLGANLGKLEARIALEELTARFPDLRLVDGQQLSFHPNISFRGPQALWVETGA
jgi:cytochrome P450